MFVKNQYLFLIIVILVSFVSGALGSLVMSRKAYAGLDRNIITTTHGFYLVSADNKPLVSLSKDGTKNPNLIMYDDKGQKRLRLGFTYEGTPALTLYDEKGTNRVNVGVKINDQPHMAVYNKNGKIAWKSSSK